MQFFFNVKYFYLDINPLKSKSKPPPELDHPGFTKDLDPITLQHLDNRLYICRHNIIYSPIYYILHTLLEFGPQCRGVGGQRGGGGKGGLSRNFMPVMSCGAACKKYNWVFRKPSTSLLTKKVSLSINCVHDSRLNMFCKFDLRPPTELWFYFSYLRKKQGNCAFYLHELW